MQSISLSSSGPSGFLRSTLLDTNRIREILDSEAPIVLLLLVVITWIGYKLFLRKVSRDRHKIFQNHFKNLSLHSGIAIALYAGYSSLAWATAEGWSSNTTTAYVGLVAVAWGLIVLVKTLRIIAYEYLFFTSMKAGVPLLLVNMLTLILSLIAGAWYLTAIFRLDLEPILATSAVLSIILGLALQDTIGNLFAGVSLQFDKPFELGDWIEVRSGGDRIIGRAEEMSWRSVLLRATTDELVTLPNRWLAQAQIINYAGRAVPPLRQQSFRIPHAAPVGIVKEALLRAFKGQVGVLVDPAPAVLLMETTESFLLLKVFYCVEDYGTQFSVADRCLEKALANLREVGIELAKPQLDVRTESRA
jgi:small-conductance mechanosensitive channel